VQNVNDAEGLSDSDRLNTRNKGRGGKGDDILDRFQTGRGERSWEGLVRGRGGGGCCGDCRNSVFSRFPLFSRSTHNFGWPYTKKV